MDRSIHETATDDSYDERKWKIRSNTSQILAVIVKNLVTATVGFIMGFPTIVIANVHNAPANSTLSLTDEEASWFGSIGFISNLIGCLISGVINNILGRKRSMQALGIPTILVCCLYYFANSVHMLSIIEGLAGITSGLTVSPGTSYVSEVTQPHIRGMLLSTGTLANLCGNLFVFLLGSFIHWRTVALICGVLPIIPLIVLFFVPESPHWLLMQNRLDDAQEALCWFRGWTTKDRIQDEYNQLFREVHPEGKTKENENELSEGRKSTCNLESFFKRAFLIPFALMFYTTFICHFTGLTPLRTYAVSIFNSFGAPMNGYYATTILGLGLFLGSLTCTVLVHYTGKRPLLFLSVAGLGVVTGGAGLYGYFYLGIENLDNGAHVREAFQGMQRFSWFPMVCLMAAPFLCLLCLRVLPWVLAAEVYPAEIRGFGCGLSAAVGYIFAFAANKTFFGFINLLTLPGVFLFYAVLAFASLPVFYFFLPETEGWSLAEVQEHFAGKRNLTKAGRKKREKTTGGSGHDNPLPVVEKRTAL